MNWLFLRGLVREQRHWGVFPETFKEMLPGHQVHFLDLPGVGTEFNRPCPAAVPAMVDDLRRRFVKDREMNEEPWSILAVSLGGMIALDWASRHPLDFQKVVVINTSAGNLSLPWKRMLPQNLPHLGAGALSKNLRRREETVIRLTINHPPLDSNALVKKWIGIAEDAPVRRRTLLRQIAAASRSKAPVHLEVPGLVIASTADRLVHWHCSQKIAESLQLPLRLHDKAGHDLPHDDPAWVADQVSQWLSEP